MNIGVDIDNVISNFDEVLLKEFQKHDTELRSTGIINEKAYKILYPYLKNHSQIFRLKNENKIFYVINVIDVIDCLDYEKSELKLFPSSGRVMRVIKYAFRTEKLKNATIFKLPEFPNGISYVTEEFKKIVEENNITGFKFKEL